MTADGPPLRLLPRLDDTNRFFWTSGADGRLRFLRCQECLTYVHPPAPICPSCLGSKLTPDAVSGRATLHSYTVNHQQWIPGSQEYIIALVEIDEQEGLRLTTNLTACEPEEAAIGMAVEVVFALHDDVYLPLFRPLRRPKAPQSAPDQRGGPQKGKGR
ncbi:MAG: OB-fold domain-containing protein [Actinobacteria bacterium]|nr:OB-fold domain-containing protein [Actinomycetota bacterium]